MNQDLNPSSEPKNLGTVLRVTGTIVDVAFDQAHTPTIFNELQVVIPAINYLLKISNRCL